MEITFTGRHTSVPERFRRHAGAKLAKLARLDHNALRIDVEVSTERNPRQADRSERVELTIRSRGPAVRAEAAAADRYAALDLAFTKLEGRLRKAAERRKARPGDLSVRSADVLAAVAAPAAAVAAPVAAASAAAEVALPAIPAPDDGARLNGTRVGRRARARTPGRTARASGRPGHRHPDTAPPRPGGPDDFGFPGDEADPGEAASGLVPMQMVGDGPLVVREKFHPTAPMSIDDALLEMELVGHDFFAFHDRQCGRFSVIYRRRGYDYGVIRLVER